MIVYGVFHNNILIFSHVMTYAIYEKKNLGESFMREIEIDVEMAHGNAKTEEEENDI